jgi:hypothetical protein
LPEVPQCTANDYRNASPEKLRAGGYYRPAAPPASAARDGDGELRRCLEASAKGFAIGAGLKGGLALFSVLVRLRSRRTPRSRSLSPAAARKHWMLR